jgi:hypothetical protein
MSWKKVFSILVKVFLACLGVMIILIIARQVTMVLVTNSLHKVAETDHFIFYAASADESLYSYSFLGMRELTYDRISTDLNFHLDQKIILRTFPSLRLLHLSWGNPFVWPADSIGSTFKAEIRELSPGSSDWLKYSQMDYDQLFSHELTHVLTGELNPDRRQTWLMEGLAVYEQSYGKAGPYIWPLIHEHVLQGDVPDLNQLTGHTLWDFIDEHGYDYGYTVVEYVVNTYGRDKLADLARATANSTTFFGMPSVDFWKGWHVYLKEKY